MKFKFLFSILLVSNLLQAQSRSKDNHGLALNLNIGLLGQLSGGDLKARFGNNNAFSLSAELMTERGNWIFGGEYSYLAGKTVKEDPLVHLYNIIDPDQGNKIYGNDFQATSAFLRERGFWAGGYIGKLIPFNATHHRTGLRVTIGVGHLQHKIRLQDDTQSITQFENPYIKGYDRLTGGLYVSEFVGYQILSSNRRINFTIGFDFMQGFTKSMRDWDWDKKSKDTTAKRDYLNGLRMTWTLPFYIGENVEQIYY
jgi:hypothetical protein